MRSKELWLVHESHATVKLDWASFFCKRPGRPYSERRIELRNLQILKKMLQTSSQFYHQSSPGSRKALPLPPVLLSIGTATAGTTLCKRLIFISPSNFLILQVCSVRQKLTIAVCVLQKLPKYVELGHFTLLFYRGQQRNVPRLKTLVYCIAIVLLIN